MGAAVRKSDGDFQVLTGNQIATLMAYYLLIHMRKRNFIIWLWISNLSSFWCTSFKIADDFGIKTNMC